MKKLLKAVNLKVAERRKSGDTLSTISRDMGISRYQLYRLLDGQVKDATLSEIARWSKALGFTAKLQVSLR